MIHAVARVARVAGQWLFVLGVFVLIMSLLVGPLEYLGVPDQSTHVERHSLALWSGAVGAVWLFLTIIAFVSLLARLVRYYREAGRQSVPTLLWRDILSKGGLAIPVSLLFLARILIGAAASDSLPVADDLTNWVPWVVWTTIPPLLGMGTFVWYELFVIEAD